MQLRNILIIVGLGILSFSGCLSVSASFAPPHQEGVCSTGCIAGQSSKYLELRLGPTNVVEEDGFSIILDHSIHIINLDAWIGTQSGQIFESDSRLQISYPDGNWVEFMVQFDKHQDTIGNVQRFFNNINLDLPIGTQLILYHTHQGVIQCPEGCGFDTTWRLYLQ